MVWSYSRVNSFSECPYKWFLTYIYTDKSGKPLKKQSGFFAEFGSYIHMILQLYFDGILKREDLSSFYVLHFKENVRAKAPNQKIYKNYFEQGFGYLDRFSFPERNILGVEEKVQFVFAGKPFQGFIDLRSDDNDQRIITDHKSRALKPRSNRTKPTKSDAELDDYLRQLYVYSAAVHEKHGYYPDILEFNAFRSGELIQEPFDPEKLKGVEDWAVKQIDAITRNDNWEARPEYWRCNYLCDVCRECEHRA